MEFPTENEVLVRLNELIKKQALIVPTMDVADWGERQHELHARVAPVRAAEYGIPIFRVASSGISEHVDCRGTVLATAPCPGDGASISGRLDLRGPGLLPFDRRVAPLATVITVVVTLFFWAGEIYRKLAKNQLIT